MFLKKLPNIQALESEAIAFIQWACVGKARPVFCFSGGKDSTVLAELVRRTGVVVQKRYSATQIDPPELVRFIKKNHPETVFSYPKRGFFRLVMTKNPPLPGYRWCCTELKHPSGHNDGIDVLILGVRAEESPRRKKYQRLDERNLELARIYPIFHWSEADVWEYIEFRQLPHCELYDQGFHRLGCILCPYQSVAEHEMSRRLWPGMYHAFENTVRKWFAKRTAQGKDMAYTSADLFLEDWYRGKAVWYGKVIK